jgi:transcriptional regulator with GAF, ATPase, and Fis domain
MERGVEGDNALPEMIGRSASMRRVREDIERLSRTDYTALVYGETGTGKELAATYLHRIGHRAGKPFVCVNCAGLPEGLIESELFGHVRGAFTTALCDRIGRFEAASGGTLFLDEIGDMSLAAQSRLLRVLETGCIERVGSHKPIEVDVRIIAATNKDLGKEVGAERFRSDLYYRLHVATLRLPPLRERIEDLPLLGEYFLERCNRQRHRLHAFTVDGFEPEALDAFAVYLWPGNIRELRNVIQYAYVRATSSVIGTRELPPELASARATPAWERRRGERRQPPNGASLPAAPDDPPPDASQGALDSLILRRTLDQYRWRVGVTATALGMHRTTLWRQMKSLGLTDTSPRASPP